jgi:hypothetical protein
MIVLIQKLSTSITAPHTHIHTTPEARQELDIHPKKKNQVVMIKLKNNNKPMSDMIPFLWLLTNLHSVLQQLSTVFLLCLIGLVMKVWFRLDME